VSEPIASSRNFGAMASPSKRHWLSRAITPMCRD